MNKFYNLGASCLIQEFFYRKHISSEFPLIGFFDQISPGIYRIIFFYGYNDDVPRPSAQGI